MPANNRVPDDLQHLLPLTPAVFFIPFALADREKHGCAIMQTASRISDNQFRMGPGTLYTTIQRLLDLGLIEETDSAGGQSDHESRRRYYKLTRTGKTVLTRRYQPDGICGALGTRQEVGAENIAVIL
jgi:DNA-binding PadR family transcriptional regulator